MIAKMIGKCGFMPTTIIQMLIDAKITSKTKTASHSGNFNFVDCNIYIFPLL